MRRGVLRRPRLAGDLDAVDLRPPAGAVLHDAGHHLGELLGDLGGDRLAHLLRVGLVDDGEVGRLDLGDQVGLHQRAVVGHGGGDHGGLHRRQLDVLLADRADPELRVVLDVPERARRDLQRHVEASASSMPKASAMSRTLSSPRSMPSWAKAVLQEMVSASIRGCFAACCCSSRRRSSPAWCVVPGSVSMSGAGIEVSRRVLAGGQGGGRHDDLEHRAGRVALVDRLVGELVVG